MAEIRCGVQRQRLAPARHGRLRQAQRLAERGNPTASRSASAARQKALQRRRAAGADQKLPAQPDERRQQRCADRRRPPACLRAEPGQQHEAEHREQDLRDRVPTLKSTATEAAPRAGAAILCCNNRARTTSPPICAAGSVVLIASQIQRSTAKLAKSGRSSRGTRHRQAVALMKDRTPRAPPESRESPSQFAGKRRSARPIRHARPARREQRSRAAGRKGAGRGSILYRAHGTGRPIASRQPCRI